MNSLICKTNTLKLSLFFLLTTMNIILPQQTRFKHLTVENGLSQSVVNCMIEDHIGFLWFGTQDGLNRFDGYNFKIFRHIPGDSSSLSGNDIWSLFEDADGNIWVGTQDGILNRFNPETEIFTHYELNGDKTISGNSITCIYRDKADLLWIGTYNGGLYMYDLKTGSVINWQNDPENSSSLSNKYVTSVYEDLKGNIWVGTYNGLCLFNKNSNKYPFKCFYHNLNDNNSLSNNIVWRIFQSPSDPDHIWIGTFNGLTLVNTDKKIFTQIIPDKKNPDQLSRSISSICEDNSGNQKVFWVGTYEGLLKLKFPTGLVLNNIESDKKNVVLQDLTNKLQYYRSVNKPADQNSISNNLINVVIKDRSGVIWIAGQKGIDYYSIQKDKFSIQSNKKYESIDPGSLGITDVQAVTQTNDKTIWIGTSSGYFH